MSEKMKEIVERRIARRLVLDGLAAGYQIAVNNGGDEDEIGPSSDRKAIMAAMFAAGEDYLYFYKDGEPAGWVRFIYGNDGWDVINDYSTSLEEIMSGANALADKYS